MEFASPNYVAIVIAAVVAFAFGAVWYGVLFKPWMKAARIKPEEAKMSPTLFITSFVAELVMAWVLAGVIMHAGGLTLTDGIIGWWGV